MKARKLFALIATAALAASLFVGPATTASAKKAKKPVKVGTDPAGDWGAAQGAPSELGDLMGQDLTGASISFDGKNVNFIISLNSLPPIGGMPEFTRYTWNFDVNGEHRELDGKFTNYSRGACDPTSGQCPPPRDPGLQPFIVRGNCRVESVGINLTVCEELAKVQGEFDAGAGTITIPVPAKLIGAKKRAKITPAANIFGGSISAAPSAYFTSSAMPLDTLTVTKTFVVK